MKKAKLPIERPDCSDSKLKDKCHAIYKLVREAWTPDKRSFEQAEHDALLKKMAGYCTCKEDYDVKILKIEPPLTICTYCGKYIKT